MGPWCPLMAYSHLRSYGTRPWSHLVGRVVEVAVGVGRLVVDGGGDGLGLHGLHHGNRLQTTRSTQSMARRTYIRTSHHTGRKSDTHQGRPAGNAAIMVWGLGLRKAE